MKKFKVLDYLNLFNKLKKNLEYIKNNKKFIDLFEKVKTIASYLIVFLLIWMVLIIIGMISIDLIKDYYKIAELGQKINNKIVLFDILSSLILFYTFIITFIIILGINILGKGLKIENLLRKIIKSLFYDS